MNEKKNIDRLFQERFKNFEATPEDSVWQKVNTTLHGSGPAKKPVPVWWKWAGIAAGIIALLTAGSYFMYSPTSVIEDNQLVDVDKSTNDDSKNQIDQKGSGTTLNIDRSDEIVDKEKSTVENSEETNQVADTDSNKEDRTNNDLDPNQKQKSSNNTSTNNSKSSDTKIADIKSHRKKPENNSVRNPVDETSKNNSTDIENSRIADTDKKENQDSIDTSPIEPSSTKIAQNNSADEKGNTEQSNVLPIDNLKNEPNKSQIADNRQRDIKNKIPKSEPNSEKTKTEIHADVSVTAKESEENVEDSANEDAVAILEDSNEKEKEEGEKLHRWDISPNVSPVYFNSFGSGSSIDSQFNENDKKGKINFSYGIKGSYTLNDKLKVRAGVNKVNLGYSTDQVIVYRNTNATVNGNERLRYVKFKDDQVNTSFISAANLSLAVIPDIIANNIKGSINQEIGFIEIPLEVEYALINKRIGLNVIGGFSTFFLNKNEVYSSLQGNRILIGEANNINNTSYSANLGFGFSIKISEKLDFNLEPTLKYQFETFSESAGDFQPYFIGIYSGLRFKF